MKSDEISLKANLHCYNFFTFESCSIVTCSKYSNVYSVYFYKECGNSYSRHTYAVIIHSHRLRQR